MKKHAREAFYNDIEFNLTESFSNNKRYFWKLVRHFVKDSKSSGTIPPLKTMKVTAKIYTFLMLKKQTVLTTSSFQYQLLMIVTLLYHRLN